MGVQAHARVVCATRGTSLDIRRAEVRSVDLVTGGSGFIGRHLVAELRRRGRKVRVFDVQPWPTGPEEVADPAGPTRPGRQVVIGDVRDEHALRRAMVGCRRVFHLAADASLWHPDPQHFDLVNHRGTETVLTLAGKMGVELVVHTSTEAILVPGNVQGPVTETTDVELDDMLGAYCRSKFLAEQAAFRFAARGLPVVVVNPSLPVGPGDRGPTPPTRMILDFLEGRLPAYLDTDLAFVDVRDAALGHVLAAEKGLPGHRHLLTGHSLPLREFFALLARVAERPAPRRKVPYPVAWAFACAGELKSRVTGHPPRAPLEGVRLSRRRMSFDDSWTRARLGFTPRPLEDSLREAVAWLEEHPDSGE